MPTRIGRPPRVLGAVIIIVTGVVVSVLLDHLTGVKTSGDGWAVVLHYATTFVWGSVLGLYVAP